MTTRTDTAPVAHLPHHHNPVTTWLIGALAADNWRGMGTFIRIAVVVVLLYDAVQAR
jgi:hypothetical protein